MKKCEIARFKKRAEKAGKCVIRGLCFIIGLSLAAGCSVNTMPADEQRHLTPYCLYGNHGDWEISCVVRELTIDEKKEKLRELEMDWESEEELLLSQEDGQKIYEQVKAQHELIRQELTEKKAYVSTITGICHNGGMDGQTFDFQLTDERNHRVISGTQVVSFSKVGQWYSSWQTETHTENGMFIPPLEKAKMIINIGDEEITIPLELSTNTDRAG